MSVEHDRARGVLLGLACGDALGRPVEGWSAGAIDREYGRLETMVGQGVHRLPAGSVTDDTEMALCIARSLVERGGFDPDDVARRFVDWYEGGPTGIGGMTRRVLGRVSRGQDWATASERVREESPEGRNAGNGSVMRCAPLAVAYADRPAELVEASRTSSRVTHADPRCTEGCAVLNATIEGLLRDVPPTEALAAALERTDPPGELRAALEPVPDRETLAVTGYVVDTLATALQVGLAAGSAREAVVGAVNAGGDTDTIGAVAGAVAGARFGAADLPDGWLDALEGREELEALADDLATLEP
jgi:ADP-ribosyl-[dinitrogen reductase] hydrolase